MNNKEIDLALSFDSLEDEIEYFRKKNDFLLEHSVFLSELVVSNMSSQEKKHIDELQRMRGSLSWRITHPLRVLNFLLKTCLRRLVGRR